MLHDHLLTFYGTPTTATTGSGQTSDPLNIGAGTPGSHALFAEVQYTAGTGTATFKVQDSDADSGPYADLSSRSVDFSNADTVKQGAVYIPVVTRKRYVKLVTTVTGSGGTVTYTGFLVTGKPV